MYVKVNLNAMRINSNRIAKELISKTKFGNYLN